MSLPNEKQYVLHVKLERFEDGAAVLRNEATGDFRWPVSNLPVGIKAGDSLTLAIAGVVSTQAVATPVATQTNEQEDKYESMRRLLEELIN